jgi:hypothetical protein
MLDANTITKTDIDEWINGWMDGWVVGIEDQLRMFNVQGWRRRPLDRRECKIVLEAARVESRL